MTTGKRRRSRSNETCESDKMRCTLLNHRDKNKKQAILFGSPRAALN